MPENNPKAQLIWGLMLTLMGVGVFFRIPQVLPRVAEIKAFADNITLIKISFYLLSFLLVVGGIKKIVDHYRLLTQENRPR